MLLLTRASDVAQFPALHGDGDGLHMTINLMNIMQESWLKGNLLFSCFRDKVLRKQQSQSRHICISL